MQNKEKREQPDTPPFKSAGQAPTPPPASNAWPTRIVLIILGLLVIGGIVWGLRHFQNRGLTAAGGDMGAAPGARSGGSGARGEGGARGGRGGRGGGGPIPVVAGKVVQKNVPIYLDGLGTVQAFNTVTVRARVDGQLKKIAFTEGQDLNPGDLLAQIDPDPYQATLDQVVAKKAQDEAQLANARLDLKRNSDLLAQKIVSQQVYDSQQTIVDQLQATVKADEASIASARVQLDYTKIVSPISGRAGIRLVDQGNIVRANDATGIVVITQLRPITVVFTLPEQNLNDIHREMERQKPSGGLTILALDRDSTSVLDTGKLAVIDNQIDTTTGTIKLKADFPNHDLRLWPGQFVNARLLLTTRTNGLVVPVSVVQRGPDGPYAFVISENMTVHTQPIKVGTTEGNEVLIEQGLQPGQRVVVDGQYKLQNGSHVKLSQSAKAADDEQ